MNVLTDEQIGHFLDQLRFDSDGLVTVVVQDFAEGSVLMVAHANREAVRRTLQTGRAHYWSRSRKKLWQKGETSGHTQQVRELRVDCDGDCVLLRVEQVGGACHEGYRSCFYRIECGGEIVIADQKVFDPDKVY